MKNISTSHILLFFLFQFGLKSYAQNNAQIPSILQTAFADIQVKFHKEKVKQLNNLDYNIPLVEKIEIRTETNDFDLRKQDITVRVSPNNTSFRRAYQSYHESVQFMTEMEYNSEVLRALTERYNLIVDYVYISEIIAIQNKKYTIALDKVTLLKKMISLSSFNIVDLIQAEDEVYRIQRTMQENENDRSNYYSLLSGLSETNTVNISRSEILSIEDIKRMVMQFDTIQATHPAVEIMSATHYNSMMEHEWVQSQSKFSLGFVQANYGYKPEDGFRNNFSIGFGFDFPLKGSSRLDLNEKKIDILASQSKYLALKEELSHIKIVSTSKLNRLIKMHELLSSQIQEGNAEFALQEYSKQSIASPLSLIKLLELNVSNEMLLIEIEEEITTSYLQFLYSTGLLAKKPYRNFLDSALSLL